MPAPHIPTPLEQLGNRAFSFYPAILYIEHNEWIFRRNGSNEIQVMNTKTQQELWVPRRFLSGVSSIEEPVVIVGLVKELEYKAGAVAPHVRRVIEMPRAVNDHIPRRTLALPETGYLAPVVGIRVENESDSRRGRTILAAVAAGILTCLVGMVLFRDGPLSSRARFFSTAFRVALPLTADDDYASITNRLGRPSSDVWRAAPGDRQFELLRYPERSLTLVLLGAGHDRAHYAGALGRGGRVIHTVKLPDGQDSAALLDFLRSR